MEPGGEFDRYRATVLFSSSTRSELIQEFHGEFREGLRVSDSRVLEGSEEVQTSNAAAVARARRVPNEIT